MATHFAGRVPACRALYDADQLPAAKRTLCRAMHLEPSDHKLRFNVALTMQVSPVWQQCRSGQCGSGSGSGGSVLWQ